MTAEFSDRVKRLVRDRATPPWSGTPECEAMVVAACTRRCEEFHHRQGRGRNPELATAANCLYICQVCHDYIGTHRCYGTGLKLFRNRNDHPESSPVAYRGSMVYLRTDGTTSPVEVVA